MAVVAAVAAWNLGVRCACEGVEDLLDAEREVGRLLGLRQRIWVGARGQCLEGVEELQGSYAVGPPMGGVQDDLLCMRNYAAMKGQGWMPAIR